jgi:hypothetical protein
LRSRELILIYLSKRAGGLLVLQLEEAGREECLVVELATPHDVIEVILKGKRCS